MLFDKPLPDVEVASVRVNMEDDLKAFGEPILKLTVDPNRTDLTNVVKLQRNQVNIFFRGMASHF